TDGECDDSPPIVSGQGRLGRPESRWNIAAPHIDPDTAPFWEAAQRGQLAVQRCRDCDRTSHPPVCGCPWCGGGSLTWEELPQQVNGIVHSFVVIHRAFTESLAQDVPYSVGLVEIGGYRGLRVTALIAAESGAPWIK